MIILFKKIVCGLTAFIALLSFSIPVSAEKVIFSDIDYKTIDNSQNMIDDSLAEYSYNRWNNSLSSYMTSNFIEGYSDYGIHTYYFDNSLNELNFTYNSEYGYYLSEFLTVSYVTDCQSNHDLAGGSTGFSGYFYYFPQQDAWRFSNSADYASSSVEISKYTDRDLRSTIIFTGIDGLNPSTASIDVGVSPLSDDMNMDDNKNFMFTLTNTYDYPVQFIAYVSPFSSAVSADYAIKSLSGTGGVFVTESWRYVISQNSFVTANTISSSLPSVMYIPKFELNLISKISDTCYDVTQFVPAGSSYSFSADWANFCSIVPDTTYYFNVVACFLPENADKSFRDKSNDYSYYVSVYSQPFSFSSDTPEYKSPTDFVQTAPPESIDWDTTFNNYLNDTYGIDSDTFNTMIKNGDKFTNIKTGDKNIDADTVLANFNTLIGALGGVAGALGSVIDTGGLGFSSAITFDDLLNLTSNPKATRDNGTGEITVIDKSKELSDYYNDYYNNQQISNAPTFNNNITVNGGSGTGTGLDIPDVDLEKYTGILGKFENVFTAVGVSVSKFVPADVWSLAILSVVLSIFLLLIGRG